MTYGAPESKEDSQRVIGSHMSSITDFLHSLKIMQHSRLVSAKRHWPTSALIVFIVAAVAGCAPVVGDSKEPLEAAKNFVEVYDRWAQDGYSKSVPVDLQELVTGDALLAIESDARWYSRGGIRQLGSTEIVDIEVSDTTDKRAVVTLTLDTSDIQVTAEGQPTWRSEETRQRLEIVLTKHTTWRVTEVVPVDEQDTK